MRFWSLVDGDSQLGSCQNYECVLWYGVCSVVGVEVARKLRWTGMDWIGDWVV